jgi:hypothetical protein
MASRNKDKAQHSFKEFLLDNGICHIVAGISYPRTKGKIERFYGEVERRIQKFGSVEKVIFGKLIKSQLTMTSMSLGRLLPTILYKEGFSVRLLSGGYE